jgi:hypothetical protein
MFLLQLSAAWVATDAARARRDRLIAAMTRTNVTRAEAAYYMRISEQQLSDQLALRHPLNLFRLCDLFQACPDLEDAYAARGLEERGWCVLRDAAILRLVDAVQAMTDRPMLKADLPRVTDERRHA